MTDTMSGPIFLVLRLVLSGFLYAFFGWALWTLWRDLRQQNQLLHSVRPPALSLIAQTSKPEAAYRFTQLEVLVGRDPACDCCLDDITISARHARLSYHHGQWWVEDLHSRNGTFLNQQPVSEAVVLTTGDELRYGQLIFQISLGEELINKGGSSWNHHQG